MKVQAKQESLALIIDLNRSESSDSDSEGTCCIPDSITPLSINTSINDETNVRQKKWSRICIDSCFKNPLVVYTTTVALLALLGAIIYIPGKIKGNDVVSGIGLTVLASSIFMGSVCKICLSCTSEEN